MKPMIASLVALGSCAGLLAPAYAQQPPAPESQQNAIKTTSEEVLLDLIVRNKKGKPITDLKPDELSVMDDGVAQAITSFRLVQGAEAVTQTGATTQLEPLQQLRLVTLAFEPLAEIDQRKMAKAAAIDLIKGEQGANVYYSVVTINNRLLVVQPFTKDKDALTAAIGKATGGYTGPKLFSESDSITAELRRQLAGQMVTGDVSTNLDATATQTASQNTYQGKPGANTDFTAPILARVMLDMLRMDQGAASQGARLSISALKALVQGLQTMPGRKSVIYFSGGMYETPELDVPFRNLMSLANRANVTFYSVDTRGVLLTGQNQGAARELAGASAASATAIMRTEGAVTKEEVMAMDKAETSGRANVQLAIRNLAEGTGGFLIGDSNDLREPLRKVNEEISSYYEVTFNPHIQNFDGSFRKLAVTSDRKDLVIHARNGYFALPPEARAMGLETYELPLLKAINDGKISADVGYRAGAIVLQPHAEGTQLELLFEVPLHGLEAKADAAKKTQDVHFSLAALVKNEKGEVVQRMSRDRSLGVTEAQWKGGNFVDRMAMDEPAGKYTLETAVIDRESGKIGTERSEFNVAAKAKGVGLSSLALVHSFRPNAKDLDPNEPFQFQGASITLTLDHTIPRVKDAALRLFFVVYPDPLIADKPAVEIQFLQNGNLLTKAPLPLPAPDAKGRIPYVMSVGAEAIPPGNYEIHAVAHQGDTNAEQTIAVTIAGT